MELILFNSFLLYIKKSYKKIAPKNPNGCAMVGKGRPTYVY